MCAVAGAQQQAGDPSAQPILLNEIAQPSDRRLLGGHLSSQRPSRLRALTRPSSRSRSDSPMRAAYDLVDRSRATFGPPGWLGFNTSSHPGRPGEIKCRAGAWLQQLERHPVAHGVGNFGEQRHRSRSAAAAAIPRARTPRPMSGPLPTQTGRALCTNGNNVLYGVVCRAFCASGGSLPCCWEVARWHRRRFFSRSSPQAWSSPAAVRRSR